METELQAAPSEKNVTASRSGFIVTMPAPDGTEEKFRIVYAPVMDPALAARYPGIRSYAGVSVSDPFTSIRFSISPEGFSGMILSDKKSTVYIDQLDKNDNYYLVVSRSDVQDYRQPFNCETLQAISPEANTSQVALRNADDGRLRTYRLALCATGEFSAHWLNGTETTDAQRKAKVLAAMNNAMTRVNGIYERDFGVRLVLIANNDAVIYLNASTDPFTTSGSWNSQTQTTCTNVIGSANYDVGHMVTKAANNGNAGCIGCVCTAGSKGSGWTAYSDPSSDYFVVDYLTHEIGHQFGGNHTFAHSYEGTIAQCEPGSGSTIMGYAGITGATTDVQPHSDDYFHSRTIEQVTNYIKSTAGSCAVVTVTGNTAPVANAGADYVIPRSTPFILTGTGSDANGDPLTYLWEQIDARTSSSPTTPSATATAGPVFRSYLPGADATRTLPRISSVLDGTNGYKWEVLPSVARTLNFRFTVKENRVGGSNNKSDDMVVTVNGTAGPFAVTAPNTAVSWAGNSAQTITWSVNNTNVAPVNCTNVKISVSTDGGNSFSTLVASTPNDGSETVTIPNAPSTTARIKIEAVGNIFFDISNTNFTITSGSACSNPSGLSATGVTTSAATLNWAAVSGALNYDVDYKLNSSSTWTNAATATTALAVNLTGLASGSLYDWRVRANCSGSSSSYTQGQFTTQSVVVCNAPTGLTSSGITSSAATISWTAAGGALSYDVDYKTNASATWTAAATGTTGTSVNLGGLTASTLYDWRVRTNCSGASSSYAQAQFTTTGVSACGTAFEPNETQATAALITAGVANSAAITSSTDIDYFRVVTATTSNNTFSLAGPSGVDFDMVIYNSAGTQIGSGTSASATETVSLTNQAAGTYYIRIFGYNGANSASCYTITATATAITGCASTYDNTTNGTAGGAALIPLNTDIKGLISPSGDNDYYRFVTTTGGTATITLTTLPADYDVRLYSSDGTTQLAISQNGGTTGETISRTYTAGTYYVRVYGYNNANNATNCYTLRVATGTATRNEYITGTPVKVSLYPNPASQVLRVNISGNAEPKMISVTDAYGRMVINHLATQATTSLDVNRLSGGVYYLRIADEKGNTLHQQKFVKD
jgi:hypothetical protein